jgi:uncharacterized protein YoxC
MLAGVISDIGTLIAAIALLVVSVTAWAARKRLQHIGAELGNVKLSADAVNRAVNNVPHGAPSLLDKIDGLHRKVDSFMSETDEWRTTVDDRLVRIEDHITRPAAAQRKRTA